MRPSELGAALDDLGHAWRGLAGLTRLLFGAAAAVALLALGAWTLRGGWNSAPGWVLGAWGAALAALCFGFYAARRVIRHLGPWRIGEALERTGGWRVGSLTTVLGSPAPGTSPALHQLADRQLAESVRAQGHRALGPLVRATRLDGWRAAAAMAAALLALASARPTSAPATMLWHPMLAWQALTAPVILTALDSTVARGTRAEFRVHAVGRSRAVFLWRAPGEGWQRREIALDREGRATLLTDPLTTDLVARVEAGGRSSDEARIAIRLPTFLGTFSVTAHYPTYLGLGSEVLPTGGNTVAIPAGTRLDVRGEATAALDGARLLGPREAVPLAVRGTTFTGAFVPSASGEWSLEAVPRRGGRLEGEPPRLALRIVPDSAPVVELPVPAGDTVAPRGMTLGVVVAARDDHGIDSLGIETRVGLGQGWIPLALPAARSDRALVSRVLDLGLMGLRPGDTLYIAARARDNAPAAHTGRSREIMVRIPSLAEQREAQQQATSETASALDSLGAAVGRAQRQTEDLARASRRTGVAGDTIGQTSPLALEAARKAEAAAREQQRILDEAARLEEQVSQLRRIAEREGLADSTLQARLAEVRDLLDQALTPEMRQSLAKLQDALRQLDADRTRTALQDVAKEQAALKDALTQARELFRRAAMEASLANLAREARALADSQAGSAQAVTRGDSAAVARAERDLAVRADSLAAALDRSALQTPAQASSAALRHHAEQARSAAGGMREASTQLGAGARSAAGRSADLAQATLQPLGDAIDQARREMQQAMRQEVLQGLDRALEETSRLAQRQLALAEQFRRGGLVGESRTEQGLVDEGASRLMTQVLGIASKNAMVPVQSAAAIAAAREAMRRVIDALSSASPNLPGAGDGARDAVDALAVAAYGLMHARDRVSGSASGSGLEEALREMQQMAGKQGQLAQQGDAMLGDGREGAMEQMMQLAAQQRAVARQLARLRANGEIPGAGSLAEEAKDLARRIEQGQLDRGTVDRQQRLFRRMLDAGRTLQGEEDDRNRERQSTTAREQPPALPPELDARLRNGTGELRLPTWETLQRLSPDERRRVLDYFHRLATGGGR